MKTMRKVTIISDSTCDLSEELKERYQIETFPLHINLGEEQYSDGVDITAEDIYTWSDKTKQTPKTSTLSPFEAEECLEKYLADGKDVICFCISETMSSCVNVMRMAARSLGCEDRVFVVDSKNLSTGIGLQIIEAAIMADEGMEAKDIVEAVCAMQHRVRASFVVDTLTYRHRGGRCSGLAAMVGGTLGLHPYISVVDGKMQPGKKYRGRMNKVLLHYVEDLRPELEKAKRDRVFITHSGCDEEIIADVKAYLEEMNYFNEILITQAGCVVTSHCGPGTLGVLFVAGE